MGSKKEIHAKVISSLFWRFAERTGAQGVTFIVSILLARVLSPEVYGTIALVNILIGILNVFIDSGLGSALIQKKDADDLDFSSVFYFNIVICFVLYVFLFFTAPLIARFYGNSTLTPVIRVLGLTLVISGIKNIQHAYVSRTMQFQRFFFATLCGTIGAAVIGVYMAYRGYGIWALVTQHVFNTAVDSAILWFTVRWRPLRLFSWNRLKGLLSYGWRILVSALLDKGYMELRQLIIGKKYSSADLAFYNRGESLPHMIIENANSSINSVLFPTMSQMQDNRIRLKEMTRRAIKTSTYIMAPLMMGLAFCAVPVVRLLLTEKWLDSVFYLRIFCITYMFYPIHTANLNSIKAMGRSDIFLKLETIKKVMGLFILFSTMWFGVRIMAYSLLTTAFLSMIINSWPNRKLMQYSFSEQMKDIFPSILLSVAMGVCVNAVHFLGLNDLVTLLIEIPLGVIIYISGSRLLKVEAYTYLISMIRNGLYQRKN